MCGAPTNDGGVLPVEVQVVVLIKCAEALGGRAPARLRGRGGQRELVEVDVLVPTVYSNDKRLEEGMVTIR